MCENLGIQANSSQAKNHDSCEHDLWFSFSNFNLTSESEVWKLPRGWTSNWDPYLPKFDVKQQTQSSVSNCLGMIVLNRKVFPDFCREKSFFRWGRHSFYLLLAGVPGFAGYFKNLARFVYTSQTIFNNRNKPIIISHTHTQTFCWDSSRIRVA